MQNFEHDLLHMIANLKDIIDKETEKIWRFIDNHYKEDIKDDNKKDSNITDNPSN